MNLRIFTAMFLLLSTLTFAQNEGSFGGGGHGGAPSINMPSITVTGRGSSSYTVRVHTQPGTYTGATPPLPTTTVPSYYETLNNGHGSTNGGTHSGGPSGNSNNSSPNSSGSGNTNANTPKAPKNTETIQLSQSVKPGETKKFHIKIPVTGNTTTFVAEYRENGKVVATIEFYRPRDGHFTRVKIHAFNSASSPISSLTPINVDSSPTVTKQASDGTPVTIVEVANTSSNTVPTTDQNNGSEEIRSPWSLLVTTGGGGSGGSSSNQADLIPPNLTPQEMKNIGCSASCGGSFEYVEDFSLSDVITAVGDCPCAGAIIAYKKRLIHEAKSCKSCEATGTGSDGSEFVKTLTDFGEYALDTYLKYESIIDASLATAGGVITTASGIALAAVPGAQGLAVIAITYGTAQTGFGIAKLSDAIRKHNDPNFVSSNPDRAEANNIAQMAGNRFEEKGIPYAGEVGYYIGETIEFTSNLAAGLTKITRAKSLIPQVLAGSKISKAVSQGATTVVNAAYDAFVAEANNKIANITDLKSTVNFIEIETGLKIEVIFEARNDDNEFIRETKSIILRANEIIENGGL